ncbi:hypothetical protein MLD38_013837 [Melastoma candidum]|uniref:Uncharacterized protein n=1 Tax=Melastoma candidum TaxID=119954 RepID=A0ACB9RC53_9MYRT|nr:hypothetical protein MLD38_013837 [Melastoma candidum]
MGEGLAFEGYTWISNNTIASNGHFVHYCWSCYRRRIHYRINESNASRKNKKSIFYAITGLGGSCKSLDDRRRVPSLMLSEGAELGCLEPSPEKTPALYGEPPRNLSVLNISAPKVYPIGT